ncbi:hypothetical protein CIRG_08087 [Coccidioides immitis RMSCC 2394]|uniref:Uncharacterized protein n=1 Tax=Coccidioides immitis RMSCC 2394 TaxID=404692 RepID=A0A0J6YIA2_COCIT|nr:hypothetical protein CIRG_08087 [Coccidioides immitis RMSCC 2394]
MAINTYGVRARKEDSGTPSCRPGRSESGFPEDDDTRTVPAVPTGPFARINRRRRGDEGIPRKKVDDGIAHQTTLSIASGQNGTGRHQLQLPQPTPQPSNLNRLNSGQLIPGINSNPPEL